MIIRTKKDDKPDDIKKKINEIESKENEDRINELKPFFGILKSVVDPLKLQKKWRNEWE